MLTRAVLFSLIPVAAAAVSGLVFNAFTLLLPKLMQERLASSPDLLPVVGLLAFLTGHHLHRLNGTINVLDAAGLGLFAVTGALKAVDLGFGPAQAVLVGAITGPDGAQGLDSDRRGRTTGPNGGAERRGRTAGPKTERRRTAMTLELCVGDGFPDFELPDHRKRLRRLSGYTEEALYEA